MGKGLIYAVASAACFGTLAILTKLAYGLGFSDTEMLAGRFVSGGVILLAWTALAEPAALRIGPRTLAKVLLLGMVISPVQSWCFVKALATLPASTSCLILYAYPAAVTLLSMAFFRLRPGREVWAALALVSLGCALVFSEAFASHADPAGMAYATAAMLIFSIYLILVQRLLSGESTRTVTVYIILAVAVVFAGVNGPPRLSAWGPGHYAVALALGLVPTALAMSFLFKAIETVGSAVTSIFCTFEPVTTVVAAHFILGEPASTIQYAGMGLIVAGIVVPNLALMGLRRASATR